MHYKLQNKIAECKHLIKQQQKEIQILKGAIFGLPYPAYWKDSDGVYLGESPSCGDYRVSMGVSQDSAAILGLDDYDIYTRETADQCRDNDLKVMSSRAPLITEETLVLLDGRRVSQLSMKTPIYDDNGKTIGILGQTMKADFGLTKNAQKFISFPGGESDIDKLKFSMIFSFLFSSEVSKEKVCYKSLTVREKEVAYCLLKGKSVKGIGRILDLSPRTIESHLDNMRGKLQCYCRSQLVDKLFSLGINLFSQVL